MEARHSIVQTLLQGFVEDLSESAKPFKQEETISFLGLLVEYLRGIYNHTEPNPEYDLDYFVFDENEFIEEHFLKPYRDKMTPFVKTRLRLYFAKDEFGQKQLFQKLQINEPVLSFQEYQEYIVRLYLILTRVKENLYLRPIEQTDINPTETLSEAQKLLKEPRELEKHGFKNKQGMTRRRQVLLYYYVLLLMGITRLDNKNVELAKFGHSLFYFPVDEVYNHDVYKYLGQAPYFKDEPRKTIIKDLEFVKRQFETIEHDPGICLVQKDINTVKGQIKN